MKIESPVQRWPGTVTLPDYLTFPQAIAWEECLASARQLLPEYVYDLPMNEEGKIDNKKLTSQQVKQMTEMLSAINSAKYEGELIKGIKECVSEWNLQNFDKDNFPATPRKSRSELVKWLVSEIGKLYNEADEIPNA